MLNEATDKEQVEIRPGIGLYALFPSLRYSPWVALGEMVDNSIQSYLDHKDDLIALHGPSYKLRVDINFSGGENPTIQLLDNAAGIFSQDIARAFTPAMPPTDKSGISQYGIGMKSSACWYSNYFTVRTRALNEPIIRTVIFDIPKIIREEIYKLEIEKEQLPLELIEKIKKDAERGGKVEKHMLNKSNKTIKRTEQFLTIIRIFSFIAHFQTKINK
jgi:hypothetical protein